MGASALMSYGGSILMCLSDRRDARILNGEPAVALAVGSAGDLYEILITLLPRPSRIPMRSLTGNCRLDGTGFLASDGVSPGIMRCRVRH